MVINLHVFILYMCAFIEQFVLHKLCISDFSSKTCIVLLKPFGSVTNLCFYDLVTLKIKYLIK